MKSLQKTIVIIGLLSLALSACRNVDISEHMIRHVDKMPSEKRPPDWENTRSLMSRTAPAVGDQAPGFTLPLKEGGGSLALSQLHASRPCVLIFGSFT